VERHLKHGLVILGTVIRVRVRRGSVAGIASGDNVLCADLARSSSMITLRRF